MKNKTRQSTQCEVDKKDLDTEIVGNDYDELIAKYEEKMAKIFPLCKKSWIEICRSYVNEHFIWQTSESTMKNLYRVACECYDVYPCIKTANLKAKTLCYLLRWQDSIDFLEDWSSHQKSSLPPSKRSYELKKFLYLAYGSLGRYVEAMETLEQVWHGAPNYTIWHDSMALRLYAKDYKEIIQIDPSQLDTKRPKYFVNDDGSDFLRYQAEANRLAGNTDQAWRIVKILLARNSNAINELICPTYIALLIEQGDLSKARDVFTAFKSWNNEPIESYLYNILFCTPIGVNPLITVEAKPSYGLPCFGHNLTPSGWVPGEITSTLVLFQRIEGPTFYDI